MRESKYISGTPLEYRKRLGQFFTPPCVAHIMVEWVMADHPKTILDPAFGLGVFYDEVCKFNSRIEPSFTGYEIDSRVLSYIDYDDRKAAPTIINGDYLESDNAEFDAVVCNPPYMRFQKFLNRHDLLPKIEKKTGRKLTGYSNIASVFLVKALKELSPNGKLAFIMPFEFFNTGYGMEIKRSLVEDFLLKQIVIFANEKDIFPDVTTTVCILFCKNDGVESPVKITAIENQEEITGIKGIDTYFQHEINSGDLPHRKKWTPIISSLFSNHAIPKGFCRVSLYGTFKRGIATGANEFFALTRPALSEYRLGKPNICKCITKSPQIRAAVFSEEDFRALYNDDKPVHCLDVTEHEKPEVRRYVRRGEMLGYHKRYLTGKRNPWYGIEHRTPSPILFGVFNRGRLKVIRNFTSAINFTCFHSFYPNIFGQDLVDKLFVYFLSDAGQSIMRMNKRSYGNGLDKLEPGDLNECLVPSQAQFQRMRQAEAERVIETVKKDEKSAIHISNRLVEKVMGV